MHTNSEIEKDIYAINGAAIEVHKVLGHGFHEKVYGDALAVEFKLRGIIVELKALDNLVAANTGQVLNYLKVANLSYALLYNFGEPAIKIKRIKL